MPFHSYEIQERQKKPHKQTKKQNKKKHQAVVIVQWYVGIGWKKGDGNSLYLDLMGMCLYPNMLNLTVNFFSLKFKAQNGADCLASNTL